MLPAECARPSFKANPIPIACSVLIYDQQMKKEEQERQKRVHKNAEISYAKAKMPSRMQRDQDRKAQLPPPKLEEEYSFQPKINKPKTAEQYKKMQKKFEENMQKKKSQMTVTRPISPNFTKKQSKPLERTYVNEGDPKKLAAAALGEDKLKATLAKSMRSTRPPSGPVQQPSSTRAMALGQARRREEIEAKKKQEEDLRKEDQDRTLKQ